MGESYSGIRALADFIRDVAKYQQRRRKSAACFYPNPGVFIKMSSKEYVSIFRGSFVKLTFTKSECRLISSMIRRFYVKVM